MTRYFIRRRLSAILCAALLCTAAACTASAENEATSGEAQPIQAFSLSAAAAAPVSDSGASAITPDGSADSNVQPEAVKQFSVELIAGEETLDVVISGASKRTIMVGVYDSDLQPVKNETTTGNDTLTFELPAGDYYVLVEYDPPVDSVQFFEGEATVMAKPAPADDDVAPIIPDDSTASGDSAQDSVTPIIPDDNAGTSTGGSAAADVQTPFTVALVGGEETLDVTVSGASNHKLTIGVYDAANNLVRRAAIEGSQKVTVDSLPAGNYAVKVEYSPSTSGVGVVEGYVAVKEKSAVTPAPSTAAPTPTPTPTAPAQTVTKIEVIVKVGKDSISINVPRSENLPMVALVGNQAQDISLGGTVTFSNLSKGTYEIEVDYKTAIPGNSPFRMTVKVPLEEPDGYVLLSKGMECYEVYLLTQRLSQLGYPVSPKYKYDDEVVLAVRLFQQENSIGVDGIAGKKTQSRLYSSSAKSYDLEDDYQTLQRGDKGLVSIYNLQQRLKDLGYYSIRVDGVYGSGTERAVRWFQKVNGLKENGKADASTQALLFSDKAKRADSSYAPDGNYETLSRSKYYNSKVVPLQRRLKELGYLSGSVDGYYGSQTYRAVRNFQSRNGLSVTGVADAATQQTLYSSSAKAASGSSVESSTGYRLLYWGCEGSAVKRLQEALINAGYKSIVRTADGIYGQWTYDAVRAYQKDHGLSVDGIAGKKTQNSLYGTNY